MSHAERPGAAARTIWRSFLNLSAGELAARLASFAALARLARVLGRAGFGRLGLALTVVSYLLIPVAQGFDSVGIRDVARDRSRLNRYAGDILSIRLASALATWTALAAVVYWLAPPMPALILLFGLTVFSAAASLKWAFQAVEQTRPVAVAAILGQLSFAAGTLAVAGPEQLRWVPIWWLAGEAVGTVTLGVEFVRRFGPPHPSRKWESWRDLLKESSPLAASSVLGTLLFNFDVLALAHFRSSEEVGLYTALYRLVLVFAGLLTVFQLSLFPTLSRAYAAGRKPGAAGPALRYLAALFVPIPFAGALAAPRLIRMLFGAEYSAGGATLQILLWSLPAMALRSVFRILLVSTNQQRRDLQAVAAGAVANITLDLALVPRLGTAGAAVSTLCSEAAILCQSWRYVRRYVEPVRVWEHLWRPAGASVLMLAAGWALSAAPLAAQAAVAAAVYLGILFFLGGLSWKEVALLARG